VDVKEGPGPAESDPGACSGGRDLPPGTRVRPACSLLCTTSIYCYFSNKYPAPTKKIAALHKNAIDSQGPAP
jgi:hypothetical protein